MAKRRILTGGIFLLALLAILSLSSPINHAAAVEGENYYFPIIGASRSPSRWIGPFGGSIVCIANDPNNTNIVYAGSWGGGVHRSVDGGITWKFAGTGLGEMLIDSLAVDPATPSTIYAGTHGSGVYKSTNSGASWVAMNNGIQERAVVYTITVNPGNTSILFAGTRGKRENSGPPWHGVLYKSNDAGNSWFSVLTDVGGSDQQDWIYSVRANPSSPDMIVAAAHEHGPFVAYSYGGRGEWFSPEQVSDWSGRAIGFDPRSWLQTAFYATWHGDGIYRSNNGGYHWDLTNNGLGFAKIYPNGIVFEPNNPNAIYLASFGEQVHGVMKSENAGDTWSSTNLMSRYIYSVGTLANTRDTVLAGTLQDGIYKSTNGGSSWSRNNKGILNSYVTGIVFKSEKIIYASTIGGGIFRTIDGGLNWTDFNNGLAVRDINGLLLSTANPNLLYALTQEAGLRVYDLSAATGWKQASIPLQAPEPGFTAPDLATEKDNPLARHEPIEELLGYTPSYSEENSQTAAINVPILSMAFSPSNNQVAYVGTEAAGIYKTTTGGVNFAYNALNGLSIRSIAFHPTNFRIVYAATNEPGILRRTIDSGVTWTSLPTVPGGPPIYSVAALPSDPGSVYAGTGIGVWKYNGTAWSLFGLRSSIVTILKNSPFSPNVLYAGTTSGSFYAPDPVTWFSIDDVESPGFTVAALAFYTQNKVNYVFSGTTGHGILQSAVP
jgi:photosystem II stability/assembly factor-like uncharacterized protein